MTLEQYIAQTLEKLNKADSNEEIQSIVREADTALKEAEIGIDRVRWFWSSLYERLKSGEGRRLMKEAQAQARLNALVQQALAAAAAMSAKYAK